MVALAMNLVQKKAWLAGVGRVAARLGVAATPDPASDSFGGDANQRLGILSFEVARTMSRLVLLYRALTEEYIGRLRGSTIRAEGVAYLNSSEPLFLLRAACAELVEDLDQAAASISRLAARCHLNWPRSFDLVYSEIKSGSGDFALGFPSKDLSKKLRKMERYVVSTSVLHEEMETLADLEASERNLERWRHYSGPIIGGVPAPAPAQQADPPGADLLMRKLAEQKRLVRKLKEESLWVRSFDRVADLMSRTVVALFARVCSIFSAIVVDLPLVVFERDGRFKFAVNRRHHNPHQPYFSGPLERPQASHAFVGSSGPIFRPVDRAGDHPRPWTSQYLEPPAGTVGESGLSLRYADVVVLAEEMLQSPESAGKDARKELYQLLPSVLRKAVKAKLRRPEARCGGGGGGDDGMAAGWRDATVRILQWLGPMAHDTVRWHSERSCERQKFVPSSQGKVLLLQTLHFANREKTEAAIVEVLVGLSCAFRYQRRTFACIKREEDENDDDDSDWSFNL